MTFEIHRVWNEILKGNSRAWRQLVETYAALAWSVALRVGLSEADAEDCLQQTWLALYRNRKRIKDPEALPAWLIRTVHRKAVTIRQRSAKGAALNSLLAPLERVRLPDELVGAMEHTAIIELAMRLLDDRCQQLILDLFLSPHKKSYRQIAKDLKVKPNSLGPLRSKCLKKLKGILKNLGYELD